MPGVHQLFTLKYGPWALVAGASEGLGAAFARALASRGMSLLLLARREGVLAELASEIRAKYHVEVRTLAVDLAGDGLAGAVEALARELEVGVVVYNAGHSVMGPFTETPLDELLKVVDVNVRGPLRVVRTLAPAMVARGRGAVVLMSSIAGMQGAPTLATYAATKAFNTVLGESLWAELGPRGVEVLVSCAGAIRTPNYQKLLRTEAPGTLDASDVAERTLSALGKGPVFVPGAVNKVASVVLGRALPRSVSARIMGASTKKLS